MHTYTHAITSYPQTAKKKEKKWREKEGARWKCFKAETPIWPSKRCRERHHRCRAHVDYRSRWTEHRISRWSSEASPHLSPHKPPHTARFSAPESHTTTQTGDGKSQQSPETSSPSPSSFSSHTNTLSLEFGNLFQLFSCYLLCFCLGPEKRRLEVGRLSKVLRSSFEVAPKVQTKPHVTEIFFGLVWTRGPLGCGFGERRKLPTCVVVWVPRFFGLPLVVVAALKTQSTHDLEFGKMGAWRYSLYIYIYWKSF